MTEGRSHRGTNAAKVQIGRALLALACVFCVGPAVWQAVTSLKPDAELIRLPPLLPGEPTASHYRAAVGEPSLPRALLNSALVATGATVLAVGLGGLCSFALARLPVGGKRAILAVVLCASMFPPIAVISPLYLLVRALGLRDTLTALILTHAAYALPLTVWILTSFFRQIPTDLYRAARVDGCSPWRALALVILPLARPALAVAALLVFIFSWNEFMFALTLTASEAARTAPVALALFPGLHEIPWGDLAAASVLVMAPVVLLAVLFQRHLVAGLTAGSVKG
ncbi:MAG: carbohydrate ABC transporter permease [Nitrospirota bacterium]